MTKPVNFLRANNTSDGNLCHVVVNSTLEVVGSGIDGNIASLRIDFVSKDDVPRSVSVHVGGILKALVQIYHPTAVPTYSSAIGSLGRPTMHQRC